MGDVLFIWTAAYQTRLKRACVPRLLSGLYQSVSSVFDQTCFNRLATHFNISMFGHQTMFDGVWSPNISRLSRPLSSDDGHAKDDAWKNMNLYVTIELRRC